MTPHEHLAHIVAQLVDGWPEHVEYAVDIKVHTDPRCEVEDWPGCPCPTVREQRADTRKQLPLIGQLQFTAYYTSAGKDSGGSSGTSKPASKIPGNLAEPDELLTRLQTAACNILDTWGIEWAAHLARVPARARTEGAVRMAGAFANDRDAADLGRAIGDLGRIVAQARVMLSYDHPSKPLASGCWECGAQLRVPAVLDGEAEVACTGCPARWHWGEWVRMANAAKPDIVSTKRATAATGLSKATLYRWASAGELTRYDGQWDLREIDVAKGARCAPVEPPPM